jgi:hypothetical protein
VNSMCARARITDWSPPNHHKKVSAFHSTRSGEAQNAARAKQSRNMGLITLSGDSHAAWCECKSSERTTRSERVSRECESATTMEKSNFAFTPADAAVLKSVRAAEGVDLMN